MLEDNSNRSRRQRFESARSTKHITVFFVGRTWDRFRLKGFAVEDRAELGVNATKTIAANDNMFLLVKESASRPDFTQLVYWETEQPKNSHGYAP